METVPVSSDSLRCGKCLRLIEAAAQIAGVCTQVDCEALICTRCWSAESVMKCAQHQPGPAERLDQARRDLAAGCIPLLLSASQARQRELAFLSRFEHGLRRQPVLIHPESGRLFRAERPMQPSPSELAQSLLDPVIDSDREAGPSPANASSAFAFEQPAPVVVEALCLSRLARYARDGFDTHPLSLIELVRVLEAACQLSAATGLARALCLASPTGWDAQAVDALASRESGRAFLHRLVLPCLLDLASGDLWSHPTDPRIKPYRAVFQAWTPEEAIQAVMDWVRTAALLRRSLPLTQVLAETGGSEPVVRQAFDRLVASGSFQLLTLPDLGLVLTRL